MYLNLRKSRLESVDGVDVEQLEKLARIVRGLIFATVEGAKSGHPGGSSSKVEQLLALLFSGALAFDPLNPKHPGRDRLVWSAGHCTPLHHSILTLIYECLLRQGKVKLSDRERLGAVFCGDLSRFRHCGGPSGHVESSYALADTSTGASGHGFSAALGLAVLQRSNGLPAKVFVLAGDAETEEGMSYEARNSASALRANNLIVCLDYNGFGIDGPITDVIDSAYLYHWQDFGWNVIEADGHNVSELAAAYQSALEANQSAIGHDRPTVIICHATKGKHYGKLENTADSHGSPATHQDYVAIMKELGFDIPGVEGDVAADIRTVLLQLKTDDINYVVERLEAAKAKILPESQLVDQMKASLKNRRLADYKSIQRPEILPPELVFKEGDKAPTRKATEAFFHWLMKQTAFFYVGAGDLMKSILTGKAENVYGVINKANPLGRGIRFGIAEQNMAMMATALTQDILPGGFQAMSAFATYGVFTSIMSNPVRMALINNAVNPERKGFFIMLAAHDGPETGEDGPTHQGLFWMSLFNAYPGIKVYKPLDANETITMLFYALEKGEPIALSVARPATPVFTRGPVFLGYGLKFTVPPADAAVQGAYVFKPFINNGARKVVLAVCGGQTMANALAILPELEQLCLDVKIIAVTSPELYEEWLAREPDAARAVLPDAERSLTICLHNGWPGFMYPFLLPPDYRRRALGISQFQKSGPPAEVYAGAGFNPKSIKEKILKAIRN